MKLIMESWRLNLINEEVNLQRPATYKAGRELTDTATDSTDKKISDLLAAFDTSTVDQMSKKYSVIGAIIGRFVKLLQSLREISQSEDPSLGDAKELDNLVTILTNILERLNSFYKRTKDEFRPGMTFVQVARKLLAKGAEGALVEGPEIFADLIELTNNKIVREVASRAGIELLAVEVLDEFIPLLKKSVGVFKLVKGVFNIGNKDPAFKNALQAKDPNKAFEMMVIAALQVDDSKSDMLGPLKALDISDEFLEAFDKRVSATFAKEFVGFLKRNSDKFMKQGMADDIFKKHVNNVSKGNGPPGL